jgi:hypothetical protein
MVHVVAEMGTIFNWASILANICQNVQETHKGNQPGIYMYVFLIDAICVYVPNPKMG